MHPELDKLLADLNVRVEAVAQCELAHGVTLAFDPMNEIVAHHVIRGDGVLEVQDGAPIAFGCGSMLLIPPGRTKRISAGRIFANRAASIVLSARDHCAVGSNGLSRINGTTGGPSHLTILCSSLSADFGSFAVLDHLSTPLIDDMSDDPAVRVAFEAMLREQSESDICTRALLGALMKQCLLLFIRRRIDSNTWPLAMALRDERIARALSAIHENSGKILRVRDLAARAGMSRSAFAKRFLEAVHVTPMEFARRARIERAANLLRTTDLPIKAVAARVGYASRSQFCRAFCGTFGVHPTAYRNSSSVTRKRAGMIPTTQRVSSDVGCIDI